MAIKYIPYISNILRGQAVLSNFTRTNKILSYKGDGDVEAHIRRGMPLYSVGETETVGDDESENMLIRGECQSACAYLLDKKIEVDLVYIDPPFASGADYAKKVYLRQNPKVAEAIAKASAELDNEDLRTFEAKMYGDIWDKERYLNWMYENLLAIKSVMSKTASIYVHLDWHIGHYVKILMDEIFGESNFRNEIIWSYRIQGINKGTWPKKHDTIFYYSMNPENVVFHPEKETIIYEKPFIGTACTPPDMSALTDRQKEKIISSVREGRPLSDTVKKYLFNTYSTEVYVRDVWDCDSTKPLISGSAEYVGYKTQKPEGLLTRIINSSSDKGMVIADFFGGSGVTAAVAAKLGRKFIHVDVNANSIITARDRLIKDNVAFKLFEIKDGVSLFRNPVQTDDAIPKLIPGLQQDTSLGSMWAGVINDSEAGKVPVYIPRLADGREARTLSVALIHKMLFEEISRLSAAKIKKVIVYYIDVDDMDTIKDYIKQHNDTLIEFEFKDLKELLDCFVAQDTATLSLAETQNGLVKEWKVEVLSFFSDRVKRKIDEYNQKGQLKPSKNYKEIILSDTGLETIEWIGLDSSSEDLGAPWHSDVEIKIEDDSHITVDGRQTSEYWDGTITSDIRPYRVKIRNICGDESVFAL